MKEIREPGAQSSGPGGGRVETAVVDEEMQFIDWKKECHCLSLHSVGAAGRTHHEATLADPAMQKQVRPEILHQFHRSCYLQRFRQLPERDVFRADSERDGGLLRRMR